MPGAPSFVFAAGRLWDEGKNVAALDRAAALLEAPVLAAGPTRGPNGARAAFRHLRALGPLDASGVAAWLAQGPLFVSLARFEPFGLAVLEAAQAGCALLLSDTPTFRELWDGAAVFLPCDADDTAVAASIRTVLADAERGAGLRAAALERAARYGTAPMTEGMLRVYGRAVAAHQDGRMRREHAA